MAWLGVVAIIGLVACTIGEVYDFRRRRKERKLAPGESLPPSWWSGRRIALFSVGGVALIAAVVVGVIYLVPTTNTATITAKSTPTTRTGTVTTNGRPAQQVRVEVLNGSGVAKAATTKAAALAAVGYPIAATGNAPARRGTIVECKPGYDAEAAALARVVGVGTTVQPFPTPAPLGSATASCVVVLGR